MSSSAPENAVYDLLSKILFIQSAVDESFRLVLNPDWNSGSPSHRRDIRACLAEKFSTHFSRGQLALLADLSRLPEASDGFVSISHCRSLGGFSFSARRHGFDVEENRRISPDVIRRTCGETEVTEALRPEFLWVAKEAGFKALSPDSGEGLGIMDLVAHGWESHYENQVFGFRLKSEKTLDFGLNKGFIFSDADWLFGFFFK